MSRGIYEVADNYVFLSGQSLICNYANCDKKWNRNEDSPNYNFPDLRQGRGQVTALMLVISLGVVTRAN